MTFEYPLYTLWYYAVIISMWNLYKINKFTAAEYCSQKTSYKPIEAYLTWTCSTLYKSIAMAEHMLDV